MMMKNFLWLAIYLHYQPYNESVIASRKIQKTEEKVKEREREREREERKSLWERGGVNSGGEVIRVFDYKNFCVPIRYL